MNNENKELTNETGLNRKFFEELIENANHLSKEDKKYIGEFKDFKNDTVGEVLKVGEKDKIKDYDRLNIKELPEEWELKLARLEELERILVENEPKIEELKVWKETFGEKKPLAIQETINLLEEKNKEISEELITEKDQHSSTQKELSEWKAAFLNQSAIQVKEKVNELEAKVKEWTQFFDYRELEEIKQEIAELRKRPDLSISQEQFWDDFAQRKSLEVSEKEGKEFNEIQAKLNKEEEKNRKLFFAINNFLKAERIRRYIAAKPILTIKEAREEIVKLLEGTEHRWSDYLENGKKNAIENEEVSDKDNQHSTLELTLWQKDKEARAREILEWIREARVTLDYEKLFEKWSGGEKYNEENDFDGTLALLKRLLEVKDFEPPL